MQSNNKDEKKDKLNNFLQSNQNSYLIKEINEIMSDQEEIKKKIVNHNKNYIELEISIPESLTQITFPVKFLLKLPMGFPKEEPELYCITKFSYPHIFDGRNLIKEVLKSKWINNELNLDTIINRIPKFIIEFNSSLEDGYLLLVGEYKIEQLYSTERIKEFPVFMKSVKEINKIKNKITKINKILTISDLSFCLYEKESKHFSKLTFHNDLNNLISMKRNTERNTIAFTWKKKGDDKNKIDIEIMTPDTEEIKKILLQKMELFGKEYNVDQKIIKKRMGKLPCTDIEKVEKQITVLEKEFEDKNNINMETIHRLMTLYQKSVEYYSAINSPQFTIYTYKIKELMANTEINDLINKTEESSKTTEDSINTKSISKKEKEEKIIIQGFNKIKNKLNSFSSKKEKEKDKKKTNIPKVALSKEDEEGGTLDVGSDDDEEEEEEDENDTKEETKEKNNTDEKEIENKINNDNNDEKSSKGNEDTNVSEKNMIKQIKNDEKESNPE